MALSPTRRRVARRGAACPENFHREGSSRDAGPRTREVVEQMLLRPEMLVLLAQRAEVMPIITKDAAVRLHEVTRGRHENARPRRRPVCDPANARRRTRRRVNLHAIDATLDVDMAPTQNVPKRCHACSKGVGIALRNGSGLAKIILGLFFPPLYALSSCRNRRRASRAGRARPFRPALASMCPRSVNFLFGF